METTSHGAPSPPSRQVDAAAPTSSDDPHVTSDEAPNPPPEAAKKPRRQKSPAPLYASTVRVDRKSGKPLGTPNCWLPRSWDSQARKVENLAAYLTFNATSRYTVGMSAGVHHVLQVAHQFASLFRKAPSASRPLPWAPAPAVDWALLVDKARNTYWSTALGEDWRATLAAMGLSRADGEGLDASLIDRPGAVMLSMPFANPYVVGAGNDLPYGHAAVLWIYGEAMRSLLDRTPVLVAAENAAEAMAWQQLGVPAAPFDGRQPTKQRLRSLAADLADAMVPLHAEPKPAPYPWEQWYAWYLVAAPIRLTTGDACPVDSFASMSALGDMLAAPTQLAMLMPGDWQMSPQALCALRGGLERKNVADCRDAIFNSLAVDVHGWFAELNRKAAAAETRQRLREALFGSSGVAQSAAADAFLAARVEGSVESALPAGIAGHEEVAACECRVRHAVAAVALASEIEDVVVHRRELPEAARRQAAARLRAAQEWLNRKKRELAQLRHS